MDAWAAQPSPARSTPGAQTHGHSGALRSPLAAGTTARAPWVGGGAARPGDTGAVPKPGAGKGPAAAVGAGREVKGEGAAVPCRAVPGGAGRGEARRPRRVTRVPPGREAIAMETQARPRPRSRPCPPGEAVVVAAEAAAAGPGRSVEPGRASRG